MDCSPEIAYIIGLIATDGYLSKDGRHIEFTSKDLELIEKFKKILKLKNKISIKSDGKTKNTYYRIQFGNVKFYKYLNGIGITNNKSKTIDKVIIPQEYFYDFLRGHFDGDGSFYSYFDKRWKNSFMFYISFHSASKNHLEWIRKEIHSRIMIKGSLTKGNREYSLRFAKKETLKLFYEMYYDSNIFFLERKYNKIRNAIMLFKGE
ncbi:MAG TPA: LAGLIDADG family homing endonuclease [Candidatus Pacearchaeota archaeon]|nr:LAGLIDADG family homing endonuclease [Candidatus Pacearchaeota archaeon]